MPTKVFISYRREDSNYQARMVHEAFSRVLPREHIFMDVDLITFGADFRKILRDECEVLLALIGPGWLNSTDPKTKGRRLDNVSDFVRIEIGEALARGIPVVPVLIDGVPMPDIDLLPNDLKELVDRQAEHLQFLTFEGDCERLIRKLGLTERTAQTAPTNPMVVSPPIVREGRRRVRWSWIAAAIAAVLAIAYVGANTFSIPVWWRATSVGVPDAGIGRAAMADRAEKEAQRDPALSVKPGSGQSFRDWLADAQPCPLCLEMVVAPAGAFTMGSPVRDSGG